MLLVLLHIEANHTIIFIHEVAYIAVLSQLIAICYYGQSLIGSNKHLTCRLIWVKKDLWLVHRAKPDEGLGAPRCLPRGFLS